MVRAERFARRFNCSPDRLGPRSAIFFMGRRPESLDLAPHMTPPEGKSFPVLRLSWNVPLSQLTAIGADKSTVEAIGDWHYWVAQGYCF